MLKIYNSLGRKQDPFVPLDPPRVRMYVCGITVYDYCVKAKFKQVAFAPAS